MAGEAAVVGLSLASAFTFAISTSLKHASASQLARRDDSRIGAWGRFARATLTHPLWLGAIAADAIGFSLQVVALHLGALALVQPLLISGLLFALILRQRAGQGVGRREILWGVVLTGALAAFLLVAGVSNPTKPVGGVNHWPAAIAVTAAALLAVICIAMGRRRAGSRAAALLGVAVGVSYASTAALLKSVTNIALRGPVPVLTSWQLYAVILSGAAGLLLNQVAFRAGPLTASLPAIATVDPLLSIALGIVIFHEHIHHGAFQGLWLSSLVLLIGTAAIQLARSGAESDSRAAAALEKLKQLDPTPMAGVAATVSTVPTVPTVSTVSTGPVAAAPTVAASAGPAIEVLSPVPSMASATSPGGAPLSTLPLIAKLLPRTMR